MKFIPVFSARALVNRERSTNRETESVRRTFGWDRLFGSWEADRRFLDGSSRTEWAVCPTSRLRLLHLLSRRPFCLDGSISKDVFTEFQSPFTISLASQEMFFGTNGEIPSP